MDLLVPEIGLLVWNTISFLVLVFVLGKFAWKPIMKGITDRERSIDEALNKA